MTAPLDAGGGQEDSTTVLRWTAWEGDGHEHAMLSETPRGLDLRGVVAARSFGLSYRIALDAQWRTRSVEVETTAGRRLSLAADGAGRWTADGAPIPALDGCLDVDLEATPATNALPVRRLALEVGAAAEIRAAHVLVPGLEARAARQRYARTGRGLYRYEGLDTGAAAEIEVDGSGFVVSYPGAFRRSAGEWRA